MPTADGDLKVAEIEHLVDRIAYVCSKISPAPNLIHASPVLLRLYFRNDQSNLCVVKRELHTKKTNFFTNSAQTTALSFRMVD